MALQKADNTVLPALERQLKEIEKKIKNIIDAIQEGMYNPSMKGRMDELEAAKESVEISIAQEKLVKPKLAHEQVVFWISRFKDGKRILWRLRRRSESRKGNSNFD